jgi:ABC-type uncharacterized transport system auxiliary subunit
MNKLIFLILPILACLWSCGSQKVIATKYYVIEIPIDSILKKYEKIPPKTEKYCEINEVDVNPAYSSIQIANRSNSRALTYYSYHHWAIRPSTSFTRLILDYFNHVPTFGNVSDRFWRVQPDFKLETTVYHLEVVQDKDIFSAHLNLEFRLKNTETDKEILKHRADRHIILETRDLNLFASAVGEIFFQELEQLNEKIISVIKDLP